MRRLIISIFVCLFCNAGHAQFVSSVSKTGTTAAGFLEIPMGVRAAGMGGAFSGVASDVSAVYWNVAGIAQLQKAEATFQYADWFIDSQLDYTAIALPLQGMGTLALHLTALGVDDEPVRTVLQPEGTGEFFSGLSAAIGVSYGWSLTDRFSVGFTGKYISERIWRSSSQTFALDFGTIFRTGFNNMRIGAALLNFGSKMKLDGSDLGIVVDPNPGQSGNNGQIPAKYETNSYDLPMNFRVGIAMELLENSLNRLTVAVDTNNPNNNTPSLNGGVEYAFAERFFLRGGYQTLFERDSEVDWTLGVGVRQGIGGTVDFTFDYAFTQYGELGDIHRFGGTLRF